jgi:hypothetical protein
MPKRLMQATSAIISCNIFANVSINQNTPNWIIWNLLSSEECRLMGCDVVWSFITTDFSEERIASIIRVKKLNKLVLVIFRSVLHFIVTANVVRTSLSLVTLMMEAMRSSETSVPKDHTA